MKWTIRIKFMLVTCGLLISCLGVYLFSAITVFESDKTQLVFDLNRSQVANLTSEIETLLSSVSDKLKVYSQLPDSIVEVSAGDLFSESSDVVMVGVYSPTHQKLVRSYAQAKFFETYGLDPSLYRDNFKNFPVKEIIENGSQVWNASINEGVPLMGFGRRVVVTDQQGKAIDQYAVVGFLKLDRFLKAVQLVSLNQILVVNVRGDILIASDTKQILSRMNISGDETFKEAVSANVRVGLQKRELTEGKFLTAYGRGFNNQIFVLAKTSEDQVFEVVKSFTARTLLFGLIILTAIILAAFLLSRSLTANIEKLADRMTGVSQGDLSTPIAMKSYDETAVLAESFNTMIRELRQSRSELEEMNRELDQKVIERTAQVEEQGRKIREIQETLIRTTRLASVGEVAGRAAHEVLNPLTILLTRLGLMQKRLHGPQEKPVVLLKDIYSAWSEEFKSVGLEGLLESWKAPSKVFPNLSLFQEDLINLSAIAENLEKQNQVVLDDVAFIKEEGERIGKIVNGMRRMGNLTSEAERHSVHGILNDCAKIMADLFSERGFFLRLDLQATDDSVIVDRDEMVQAFTNLMRNSLQSLEVAQSNRTGAYGVKISTSINGGQILLKFEDNGVGISEAHKAQIFSGSFTTKSRENGTGLGLGISRRFVRNYAGDIGLDESRPYESTVFVVSLPLANDSRRISA